MNSRAQARRGPPGETLPNEHGSPGATKTTPETPKRNTLITLLQPIYYSNNVADWKPIGPVLDASILSDENAVGGFTGAYVGLCCQDLTGQRKHADFDWFEYIEK